jgi:hypothetical protein
MPIMQIEVPLGDQKKVEVEIAFGAHYEGAGVKVSGADVVETVNHFEEGIVTARVSKLRGGGVELGIDHCPWTREGLAPSPSFGVLFETTDGEEVVRVVAFGPKLPKGIVLGEISRSAFKF